VSLQYGRVVHAHPMVDAPRLHNGLHWLVPLFTLCAARPSSLGQHQACRHAPNHESMTATRGSDAWALIWAVARTGCNISGSVAYTMWVNALHHGVGLPVHLPRREICQYRTSLTIH
jgi:hypothetical protein